MLVLLEYPESDPKTRTRTIQVSKCAPNRDGQLQTAVIGAGGFAQGMHLPNLLKLSKKFALNTICSRTVTSSLEATKHFGIATATTDYDEVLANEKDIDYSRLLPWDGRAMNDFIHPTSKCRSLLHKELLRHGVSTHRDAP